MSYRPDLAWETLPCGCRLATDPATQAFLFEPHALDCQWLDYVQKETARQGKPFVVAKK